MTQRTSRIVAAVSLAVLVLLTVGRIALVDHLHDQGFFAKYIEFADRILAGDPPRERIADVSPAYLWLIVLFRAMGMGVTTIRNVQIVMLSLAALFAALAAKRLGGWFAAAGAAVLILGSRAALVTATELEPETLILLLNCAAIAVLVAAEAARSRHSGDGSSSDSDRPAERNAGWVPMLFAGLLIGMSAIARPTALATLVLVALWIALRSRRGAIVLVAAALIPIVAVLLVNRSLTGHMIIMQPGTHVYEGNNPLATGCAGVMPRVVADMNVAAQEPDYLHVAYRLVASRATGAPMNAKLSNRFWSSKAFAYMRTYPLDALELFAWKAVLSVHHYDIYDLITTKRKADELSRWPAIPFGVSFVLSLAALGLRAGRRRELVTPLLFAAAILVALVAFNVSSRQRNALLAPLAILGGAGASEIILLARRRSERALFAFGAFIILTPILGIEGAPMREDAYNWWSSLRSDALREAAVAARAKGDRPRAAMFAATSSILNPGEPPLVSARTLVGAALDMAKQTEDPQRLFDIAIALQKGGAWRESDDVLQRIADYRPLRENRAVSSVAYYRARAAVHSRRDPRPLLDAAEREAPGDPDVLALRFVCGDRSALRRLDSMHDPFTRDVALAGALDEVGDSTRATALRAGVRKRLPEWVGVR